MLGLLENTGCRSPLEPMGIGGIACVVPNLIIAGSRARVHTFPIPEESSSSRRRRRGGPCYTTLFVTHYHFLGIFLVVDFHKDDELRDAES